jgi:RNA polymerase sigma factor (sigma-70 family)
MYHSRDERRRSVDRLATELFKDRRTHLTRVARHHCRREADVEDAMQEAFAAFLTEYDPVGRAPALPWLTVVLKRKCWRLNERRALKVEPLALAEVLAEESLDPALRIGGRDEARRRLAALKSDERRALLLHAAGFTYGEIGGRCGWTATKVNRCLYEGRIALRGGRPEAVA